MFDLFQNSKLVWSIVEVRAFFLQAGVERKRFLLEGHSFWTKPQERTHTPVNEAKPYLQAARLANRNPRRAWENHEFDELHIYHFAENTDAFKIFNKKNTRKGEKHDVLISPNAPS